MVFKFRYFFLCFALLSVFSCSSRKLVGSWEFIDIYDGEIRQTDTLKTRTGNSRYGAGILTFYQDKTFTSIGNSGTYQAENDLLKMKYSDAEDTVSMKISHLSKDELLLFSITGSPKTWFYKKVKEK